MSADKYPSIFSRQMATIVYIEVYLIVKYIHNNFIFNKSAHIKNIVVTGFEIIFLTGPQFQCCFVVYFKVMYLIFHVAA